MERYELENIENRLLNLKSKLEVGLKVLFNDSIRNKEVLTSDLDDQSIIVQNDEVIEDLDQMKIGELKNIDHALYRIKFGGYGFCEICSEKINPKRLKSLPYTSKCFSCCDDEKTL